MNVGDRVAITDPQRTHNGTVVTVKGDGMLTVKWDSGMTELVHESELGPVGRTLAPRPGDAAYDDVIEKPDDEEAYADDDPKHPTFRERVSSFWDSIAGK